MPFRPMPARARGIPARGAPAAVPARAGVTAPPPGMGGGITAPPPGAAAGAPTLTPSRGTVVPPPADNKGFQSAPVAMAAGGPVLGRTKSFMKIPDEFTGGRLPTKQTAPAPQDYG